MTTISNLRTPPASLPIGERQSQSSAALGLNQLTEALLGSHGELMSGTALYRILGFKSAGGFRQARRREPASLVPIFQIPQRRGYFAMTRDVAAWLYRQRASGLQQQEAL